MVYRFAYDIVMGISLLPNIVPVSGYPSMDSDVCKYVCFSRKSCIFY